MGTLHYAVNVHSKQAVELGKYHWSEIDGRCFTSVEELAEVIDKVLSQDWFDRDIRSNNYAAFVASELWRIGNEYKVITENYIGCGYDDFLIVGSRYIETRTLVGTRLGDYLS